MKPKRISSYVLCIFIALTMILGSLTVSFGGAADVNYSQNDIEKYIEKTGEYLIRAIGDPGYSMVGGDWSIIGLSRSQMKLPEGYTESYYKNVQTTLTEEKGELTRNKYSEYSRLILTLTAIGKNPANVAGYNLIGKLSDLTLVEKQGINGPIYALMALDSFGYSIPKSEAAQVQSTEDLLIGYILERELAGGGFCLSGTVADPDVTAAVLQAFSNHINREDVKAAVDRSLKFLSSVQTDSGGFTGWTTQGTENTESIVQVILALTSLGIDPTSDERFIKADAKGKASDPMEALMSFRLGDGSYRHIPEGDSDLMATEQAMLALVAYQRLQANESPIFHMKDSSESDISEGSSYEYKVLLNGKYLTFDQPPINRNSRILVPMRGIFEALGADVQWDNDLRKVTGILGDRKVQLVIGEKTAYINDNPISLDVPAIIVNSRTMVPVRFISESLNANVDWDAKTNTAIIVTK